MKLTRYGTDVIIGALLLSLFLIIGGLYFEAAIVKALLITLGLAFALFTLYFFRDPDRTLPLDVEAGIIVSPADGKVVVINEDLYDDEYLKGPAKQISIFLSPLNVHVNRFPLSGTVDYFKYVKGQYLVAFHEKSSELNERTHIGVRNERTRVMFKQIAGAVARRIVCPVKVGDEAQIGERFGMIKFGSRMDLIVEPGMVIQVKLGDKVVAGETILCRLPND